ncbi:MAG: hypothetical protein H0W83_06695 [Planctomycetes bacterium]|nr:hypothetical protein [Planctomycetota bacterium]
MLRASWPLSALVAALVVVSPAQGADPPATTPPPAATKMPYKWVYISKNFMDGKNVDATIEVLTRAAKAGYNGIYVTDCKFSRFFETVTVTRPEYDNNLKRLRQACRDLKLAIYASTCNFDLDLLSNDPNLAEGMPVVEAPFVVRNGKLIAVDDDAKVQNPSFESAMKPDSPTGWNVDDPGSVCFIDTTVACEGSSSLRIQDIAGKNAHGNGRATQVLAVKPFRYYNLSMKVKTEDFVHTNSFGFAVKGAQDLAYERYEIQGTQDWTRIDIPFNTLDNTQVTVMVGSWGGKSGKLWIDDVRIEPGGFVNLLRRESLPFIMTSTDKSVTFSEGSDFTDARDPKLGNTRWPGLYQYWYEQPVVTVPAKSRLKEGDRVLVSYAHAAFGDGVVSCMNEANVWPIMQRNLHELHTILQPDGYILPHDEIRCQGWDATCTKVGKPMATVLGEHFNHCADLIRAEDPGKPIFVWSDMFDPHHNASKKNEYYHLVKGIDPWYGSWEALGKDIIILNWHGFAEKRPESLKHFADRGNHQILCGYYDESSDNMIPWLAETKGLRGIDGVMYTSWSNNYSELEHFLEVVGRSRP